MRRDRHHDCTAQTHENIRIERLASDILCSVRRKAISCDSRQPYESNRTLQSSVTCISKKIHETRTDEEWHTAWINPRVPLLGVDTQRDIHPVVSSFHQTYKADKKRSCYLGTGWALFTHKEPGGHYFSWRESRWHHVPPTAQQSQTVPLDKAFMEPSKYSTPKKMKYSSVQT